MASYDVELTSSAEKELKMLSGQLIARMVPRLEDLASNPRPPGCKKLRGGDNEWRIRVGDYRIGLYHRRRKTAGGGDANRSPKRGIQTMIAALVPGDQEPPVPALAPRKSTFLRLRRSSRGDRK